MNYKCMGDLVGKEVQIYPNDSYKKYGVIVFINDYGILFKITKSYDETGYPVGAYRFISYSANLTFLFK